MVQELAASRSLRPAELVPIIRKDEFRVINPAWLYFSPFPPLFSFLLFSHASYHLNIFLVTTMATLPENKYTNDVKAAIDAEAAALKDLSLKVRRQGIHHLSPEKGC